MKQDTKPNRRLLSKLAAGLLFAVASYGGMYASVVTIDPYVVVAAGEVNGLSRSARVAIYPKLPGVRGKWVRRLFAPAHWFDQRMRPHVWIVYGESIRF